jgi:hypothetical protein
MFDACVVAFISMLFEKDRQAHGDFEKICGHSLFGGLDIERVLTREIQPSYVAAVSGIGVKTFESEFSGKKPMDSFADPARQASVIFARMGIEQACLSLRTFRIERYLSDGLEIIISSYCRRRHKT